MWHETRHRMILNRLARNGSIAIADIVTQAGVSRETARRDLDELQARGLLLRRHGGAVMADAPEDRPEPSFSERLAEAKAAKQLIAERVVTLLPPNAHCFIDAGTTTACLGRALMDRTDLTIVTNSLPIARTLTKDHKVTLLGGEPDADRQGTYGALTVAMVQRYHTDFAIISPVALDVTAGLTSYALAEAMVAGAMVEHAAHTIALAHAAKIGQRSRVQICRLDRVQTLVSELCIADKLGAERPAGLQLVSASRA